MTKRMLFVLAKPPHQGAYCQEMLDFILTAAAFDQEVTLLFLDDGVFQLKKNQQVTAGVKDTSALFQALALYGVSAVYVEQESLAGRGLTLENLSLPVQICHRQAVSWFMQQFDSVLAG